MYVHIQRERFYYVSLHMHIYTNLFISFNKENKQTEYIIGKSRNKQKKFFLRNQDELKCVFRTLIS